MTNGIKPSGTSILHLNGKKIPGPSNNSTLSGPIVLTPGFIIHVCEGLSILHIVLQFAKDGHHDYRWIVVKCIVFPAHILFFGLTVKIFFCKNIIIFFV